MALLLVWGLGVLARAEETGAGELPAQGTGGFPSNETPLNSSETEEALRRGREARARLDQVESLLQSREGFVVTPATNWGQSLTEVYLRIKLAIRHHLPPCVSYRDFAFNATGKALSFQATCDKDDHRVTYRLELELLWEVQGWELLWESPGEVIAKMAKVDSQWWIGLLGEGRTPPNSKIWWGIKKLFPQALSGDRAFKFGSQEKVDKMLQRQNKKLQQLNAQNKTLPAEL